MKNWIDNLIDSKGNWLVAEEAIANLKRSAPNLYNEVMDEIRIRGAIDDATLETKGGLKDFEIVGDRKIDITDKEITPNITTPKCPCIEDCEDLIGETEPYENEEIAEKIYSVHKKFYSVGKNIMKEHNGILDKDVFLDILCKRIKESGIFVDDDVKREWEADIDGLDKGVRRLSIDVFNSLVAKEILEWRNLMLTRKGYTRMVRMFSEFFAQSMAGNFFGTPLNIGCTYPRDWDRF